MRSQNEVHDHFDTQDLYAANPDANEMARIEEIFRRAQEIHRERGGVFGYDFEDWLQAWGELPERCGRAEIDQIE
jgi:hypothetical protein